MSADVRVFINRIRRYDFIEHRRQVSLQDPCMTGDIIFRGNADLSGVAPGSEFALYEEGQLILDGFVDEISSDILAGTHMVKFRDRFKLAQDYFIEESLVSEGESSQYWAQYICDLIGLTPIFSAGSGLPVSRGTQLGRMHAAASLTTISAASGWVMRMTPGGELQFLDIPRPAGADYTLPSLSAVVRVSDATTRNVVKVWGHSPESGGIYVIRRRDVPGVEIDRIAVYANPNIDTVARAADLAEAALDQWASLETTGSQFAPGNPNVRVGQSAEVSAIDATVMDTITDLSAEVNREGYTVNITVGRRDGRYPRWPISVPNTGGAIIFPPQYSDVEGVAWDVVAWGTRYYVVGYRSDVAPYGDVVRIECRRLRDGTLVWARDHAAFGYASRAYCVTTNGTHLFIGVDAIGFTRGYIRARMSDGFVDMEAQWLDERIGYLSPLSPGGIQWTPHGLVTFGDNWFPPTSLPHYIYLNRTSDFDLIRRIIPLGLEIYIGTRPAIDLFNSELFAAVNYSADPPEEPGIDLIEADLTAIVPNLDNLYPTMRTGWPTRAPTPMHLWVAESRVLYYTSSWGVPLNYGLVRLDFVRDRYSQPVLETWKTTTFFSAGHTPVIRFGNKVVELRILGMPNDDFYIAAVHKDTGELLYLADLYPTSGLRANMIRRASPSLCIAAGRIQASPTMPSYFASARFVP